MELKITTLIENHASMNKNLKYELGISMLVETDGKRILFDTGDSGDFIQNAKTLHADLNHLDACVISHSHFDHVGGYKKFVENFPNPVPLYVGSEFFKAKYSQQEDKSYRDAGVVFDESYLEAHSIAIHKVVGKQEKISENIYLFHNFEVSNDFEEVESHFYTKKDDKYIKDKFDDEIALGIKTTEGLVVLVGCSHIGIVNILTQIKTLTQLPIRAVIGGTHLIHSSKDRIAKTIETFDKLGVEIAATSHCTGDLGMQMMEDHFKENYLFNNVGKVIEF